ncbi:hypothetical protein BDM02DRAFT_2106505 [Thelephora ganbajun]|uniref:Uncharacterized protein n=1 Tax=Thelephora ganbajun TaxID=370292 RepID=A0ACB6ZTW8_THEGA|nr:hypothetical protein BDM02DRAFT_2106505 [Thelephora ganbajun]
MSGFVNFRKTVRCRYFTDSGSSIKPGCNQRDRCNFAHPDDLQWHDASPVSKKHALETKDYRDIKRRPPALTPQSDLFKRSNPEDREDKRRSSPKTYDSRSFLGVEKPDDRHHSRGPRVLDERLRVKKDDSSTRVALPRSRPLDGDFDDTHARSVSRNVFGSNLSSRTTWSDGRRNAEAIVNLFRQLAETSSKIVQDSVEVDRENRRVDTLTDLSSTLAQVSTAATSSVAPALINAVRNHALLKDKVDDDYQVLVNLWEDLFDLFVKELWTVMDKAVRDGIATLGQESDRLAGQLREKERERRKRREEDTDDGDRDHKRRRIDVDDAVLFEKDRVALAQEGRNVGALEQLKSKLEEQAHRLEKLTRENTDVSCFACWDCSILSDRCSSNPS